MASSNQQIEHRTAEWLSQRDSGQWSERDQAALEDWLDESTAHTVAFIRLEAAWRKADRFKALGAGLPSRTVPTPEQFNLTPVFDEGAAASAVMASVPRRPPRKPLLLSAAAALVCAAAGLAWHFRPLGPSYSTPIGGLASVPMKDGSKVTLNTDSEIRVALTDKQRSVELQHGEAFFEVAADPSRPFVVSAGDKRIVVLGTRFSVRRDRDDVRVVVTEGKVRVEDAARTVQPETHAASSADGGFVLAAGGIARTGSTGMLVQSKPLSEVQEALSWRLGFVVFRDVDLTEAVDEFNRYNETKIVIQDPAMAEIRLSGKFKATNVAAFVRLLEDGFRITARQEGERILLAQQKR